MTPFRTLDLRRARTRLALGLVLGLVLALAWCGAGLAATSEACLRRCVNTCEARTATGADGANATGDASAACLRPCLRDCPVHCATVDTDCALGCLDHAPKGPHAPDQESGSQPWEAGNVRGRVATLVGACAATCEVRPDCRPSAYDQGPSELAPPEVHRGGAGPRPGTGN